MALRPCLTCGVLTNAGSYCQCHLPRNGSARQWRNAWAVVLAQDPFCAECDRPAEHVDHMQPTARGGTDQLVNLQALCAACNLVKGDR